MKKGWIEENIESICEFFADGNWIESKDQSNEGIRLIQTGNIGNGIFKDRGEKARYISENTFKRLRCTEIYKGDCLISRLPDPVGRACIIPVSNEKKITAVDCTIIRFKKEKIQNEWFIYYSQSNDYQNKIGERVSGATRQRISRKNLGQITIPLPPLDEQKRIVAILDEAFAAIDKAKANAEKNLANAKELFESYLNGIFANPGEDWEINCLDELGTITSSKRIYKNEYVKDGVPFYRTKEIKELSNCKAITLELFISRNRYNQIKQSFGVPQIGDLLMSAVGTIGEIIVIENDNEFYFKDGNIVWFKNFKRLDTQYLKYALTAFVENIKNLAIGAAYSALTIEKLNKYRLAFPKTIKEQQEIVRQLDSFQEKTRQLDSIYQKKLIALTELKKSILKKAFEGELQDMAKAINIDIEKNELIKILQKTVQSCNLNFLIGSGCSIPAMKALGPIEQEVEKLYQKNKDSEAIKKLADFLKPFIESTKLLINNNLDVNLKSTINNYSDFLKAISLLLFERKSHILHKQATIFSTNYDMFIEKAVDEYSDTIVLNDGFCRNPSLTYTYSFSPRSFFNTVSNTGNLYKYQVEIPSINLIKMHGSLNWQICDGKIYQTLEHLKNTEDKNDKELIDDFTLILPRKDKFNETLLNQVYYDLLRIYSNELDKENTLLIAEGFSFADEHIYDITKRALKNPTLRLILFCFKKNELDEYENKFNNFNNVNIIYSDTDKIDFGKFITIISEILPKKEETPVYKVEIKEPKDE